MDGVPVHMLPPRKRLMVQEMGPVAVAEADAAADLDANAVLPVDPVPAAVGQLPQEANAVLPAAVGLDPLQEANAVLPVDPLPAAVGELPQAADDAPESNRPPFLPSVRPNGRLQRQPGLKPTPYMEVREFLTDCFRVSVLLVGLKSSANMPFSAIQLRELMTQTENATLHLPFQPPITSVRWIRVINNIHFLSPEQRAERQIQYQVRRVVDTNGIVYLYLSRKGMRVPGGGDDDMP